MLDKNVQASISPDSFRTALAGWSWAKSWSRMPADDARPKLGDARYSLMLSRGTVVSSDSETHGRRFLVYGTAKWAGVGCELRPVDDGNGQWSLWRPTQQVEYLYVTKPTEWRAQQVRGACPLELHLHNPGVHNQEVMFVEVGLSAPLFEDFLSRKLSLSFQDLKTLGLLMDLQFVQTRASIIQAMVESVFIHQTSEFIAAKIAYLLGLDLAPDAAPEIDALTEQALTEMDDDDKKEFDSFGKILKARNKKRKISDLLRNHRDLQAQLGRGRGRGRGRGAGRGGRGQGPAPPEPPPPAPPVPVPPAPPQPVPPAPAPPVPPEPEPPPPEPPFLPVRAPQHNGAGAVGVSWGRFRFTAVVTNNGLSHGYRAMCNHHDPEAPFREHAGGIPRPCSRELSIQDPSPDAQDRVLRTLKVWCLACTQAGSRTIHMDPFLFPRRIPADLPGNEILDQRLRDLPPR